MEKAKKTIEVVCCGLLFFVTGFYCGRYAYRRGYADCLNDLVNSKFKVKIYALRRD